MLEKRKVLDLVRDFVVFEDDDGGALVKKTSRWRRTTSAPVPG